MSVCVSSRLAAGAWAVVIGFSSGASVTLTGSSSTFCGNSFSESKTPREYAVYSPSAPLYLATVTLLLSRIFSTDCSRMCAGIPHISTRPAPATGLVIGCRSRSFTAFFASSPYISKKSPTWKSTTSSGWSCLISLYASICLRSCHSRVCISSYLAFSSGVKYLSFRIMLSNRSATLFQFSSTSAQYGLRRQSPLPLLSIHPCPDTA